MSFSNKANIESFNVVLDSPDPQRLANFYGQLLGWDVTHDDPTWSKVSNPEGGAGISVQLEELYQPPTWPARRGDQLMMSHLDFTVQDVDQAVADVQAAGGSLAETQPSPKDFTVLLDPDGHPFCVFTH